jgi:hypothetical protein
MQSLQGEKIVPGNVHLYPFIRCSCETNNKDYVQTAICVHFVATDR